MVGILGRPYISLDPFIDVAALTGLEMEIMLGLARCDWTLAIYGPSVRDPEIGTELTEIEMYAESNAESSEIFERARQIENLGARRKFLKLATGCYAPAHTVHLRKHHGSHYQRANREHSHATENQVHFPNTMKFIESLPFSDIGRTLFFIHEHGCKIPIHMDGKSYRPHHHEFMYLRTNLNSKFYVYDEVNDKKHFVQDHAVFFNERDYHGGDAADRMTFSLRIDGIFTPEFRKEIGIAHLEHY